MKLQQLRYLREVAKRDLNLSEAAEALHTSQPGISKQIRLLEDELGVVILVRNGKRVVDVTEPGRAILGIAERILQDADNLRQVAREFRDQAAGTLTIATTHTQARYSLPKVVSAFKQRYPKVRLTLKQGSPPQLAEMVLAGEADIAIATEALDQYPKLLALAGYQNVTQVVLGASGRSRWQQLLRPSVINRVIRDSGQVDVHVISMEAAEPHVPFRVSPVVGLPLRRRALGAALALALLADVAMASAWTLLSSLWRCSMTSAKRRIKAGSSTSTGRS